MTNQELSRFIENYIEHDKTRSAIMLTAPWGTGKSYYIQNELIPYLEENEHGNHKCIVISLYGLTKTFDVSKAIYFEEKLKFLTKKGEKNATSVFAAKTVLKGVTSFFGIDLSKSEKEMQRLYKSIDLSGRLIVLEDVERAGIDIIELLGFVNNLAEQDGVKVMLVLNEDELVQYEPVVEEHDEKQKIAKPLDHLTGHEGRQFTKSTQKYLLTKEKTISDTIRFEGDCSSAVKSILSKYSGAYFKRFTQDGELGELIKLLYEYGITNLRSFIFACQKADDIFARIKPDVEAEDDFIKTIFYSIIVFSDKIKSGNKLKWENNSVFSTTLSSEEYPLFRFCYDYIIRQSFESEMVESAKEALHTLRLYDKKKSTKDKDLRVLYNWWVYSEEEIVKAVRSVSNRLKEEGDISFYEYGRIALYMVAIKHVIGCDIETAKKHLIENLHNKGDNINADYLFPMMLSQDESPEVIDEYSELKTAMIESLAAKETPIFDFDYQPSSVLQFAGNAMQKEGKILKEGAFAARLDPDRVVEMLKKSTAMDIQEFRSVFQSIYRSQNIKDYLSGDKHNIDILLEKIEALESYDGFDKIQKMQIGFFIKDLKTVSKKL